LGYIYAGGIKLKLENLACKQEVTIPSGIINNHLKALYDGVLKDGTIDKKLWEQTYKEIYSSFEKSYGKSLANVDFNSPDWEYLQNLKYNTAVFSAFKQNDEIKNASALLFNEDGTPASWKQFYTRAMEVSDTYNKRWLQTEYNQAHSTAKQARKWRDYETTADLYPNLIYIAVMDGRTRPDHAKLHGTILPINDPFWNTYSPPNGWGCRCTVRPTDKKATSSPGDLPTIDTGFSINPGKEAKIFSDDHPYVQGNVDKANAVIAFVQSQMRSVTDIKASFATFNAYNEAAYTKAYFNGNTGGYGVFSKEHIFDKKNGKFEKGAISKLAGNGMQVEAASGNTIKINGTVYNLKSMITGTDTAVKNALWEAFAQGSENVVLYWPNGINTVAMRKGVDRLYGQMAKAGKKVGNIYYIDGSGDIHKLN